ncbi:MAG: polyphosphate kinase 2, partial [Thauera sp.]|nr:polyphosphate kinase 2 [Thauera sp.]
MNKTEETVPVADTPSTRARKTRTAPRSKNKGAPRASAAGDTAPDFSSAGIEDFEIEQAIDAAQDSKLVAVKDILAHSAADPQAKTDALEAILDGASPDDIHMLRRALMRADLPQSPGAHPDDELSPDWRKGGYPYRNLMSRKAYEKQKYRLQVELLKLQAWVKETGQRVVILFEGRDA